MKIIWIGHSCFKIEKDGYSIILDPYEDGSVPGLSPIRETANMVLCSHEHGDHNARRLITIEESEKSPFTVTKIETFHDGQGGALRGRNTIHIIDDGEQRIAHLGDLGCELEPEQLNILQGLDAALIPVGGFFTIDAGQAASLVAQIQPRIVIPMHYRCEKQGIGYDVIGTVEAFTELMPDVMLVPADELDSSMELCSQVVVLRPRNGRKADF